MGFEMMLTEASPQPGPSLVGEPWCSSASLPYSLFPWLLPVIGHYPCSPLLLFSPCHLSDSHSTLTPHETWC